MVGEGGDNYYRVWVGMDAFQERYLAPPLIVVRQLIQTVDDQHHRILYTSY